jgi:hypothetical protein
MAPPVVDVGLVPTVAYFYVTLKKSCAVSTHWNLRIPHFDVDVTDSANEAAFDPDYLTNAETKPVSVDVRLSTGDSKAQQIFPYGFRLRRGTSLTHVHITPKTVRRHGSVNVAGQLVRANWDTGRNERYAAEEPVNVEWTDPSDGMVWFAGAPVDVSRDGSVEAKIQMPDRRNPSGVFYWRLVFPGDQGGGASVSAVRKVTVEASHS